MNPVFWLLVILGLVAAWFGLTGLFRPLGGFLNKIYTDAEETINEEDEEEREREK